jgi:hypothetical protein
MVYWISASYTLTDGAVLSLTVTGLPYILSPTGNFPYSLDRRDMHILSPTRIVRPHKWRC